MAGIRWQIRRTDTYDYTDGMWPFEPLFHTIDNRLGVQGDIFMSWFPFVDPDAFRLDTNWSLTGKAGNVRHMQAVWDHPNEFVIRHIHPTHPYIEDHLESPAILTVNQARQTVKAGPDEFLNNGASNSLENFEVNRRDMDYQMDLDRSSVTADIKQLSGNGFLWLAKVKSQNFAVTVKDQGTVDNSLAIKNKGDQRQTWAAKGKNVIGFNIKPANSVYTTAGRGIGYRSWAFFEGASDERLTFSFVVNDYFIPGMRFSTRIGQPGNWQLFTTQMQGVGQQHMTFFYDPNVNFGDHSKPLAIDWFYDWYYDASVYPLGQNVRAEIGCMSVHPGWIPANKLNPAFHSFTEDQKYASSYGFSSKKEYAYSPIGTVTFKTPLLSDTYRLALTSQKKMSVLEKTREGFVYTASDAVDGEAWTFTYSAKVAGDLSDVA